MKCFDDELSFNRVDTMMKGIEKLICFFTKLMYLILF